ncbi:hypothetical protein CL617_03265 [archaeon]|nr:hypothetical protein [archaeon]|tara:strand:- start:490 stop:846 length:357 start_codon:yes stop_codon:yes gene_type:complete
MVNIEKEVYTILYVLIPIIIAGVFTFINIRKRIKLKKQDDNLIDEIKTILDNKNPEIKVNKLIEREKKKVDLVNKDVKKVLEKMDELLGNLPEEEIEKFSKSKDFHLYEKVLTKFEIE